MLAAVYVGGLLGDGMFSQDSILLTFRIRLPPGRVSVMVHGIWLSVPAEVLTLVLRSKQPVESGDLRNHFQRLLAPEW